VTRLDEAERVTQHYLDALDTIKAAGSTRRSRSSRRSSGSTSTPSSATQSRSDL
jgi:hypothetical protein